MTATLESRLDLGSGPLSERFDEALPLYGWQEDIDFTTQIGRRGRLVLAGRRRLPLAQRQPHDGPRRLRSRHLGEAGHTRLRAR